MPYHSKKEKAEYAKSVKQSSAAFTSATQPTATNTANDARKALQLDPLYVDQIVVIETPADDHSDDPLRIVDYDRWRIVYSGSARARLERDAHATRQMFVARQRALDNG